MNLTPQPIPDEEVRKLIEQEEARRLFQAEVDVYSIRRARYQRVVEILMPKATLGSIQREDVRHALDVCDWIEEEIERRLGKHPVTRDPLYQKIAQESPTPSPSNASNVVSLKR